MRGIFLDSWTILSGNYFCSNQRNVKISPEGAVMMSWQRKVYRMVTSVSWDGKFTKWICFTYFFFTFTNFLVMRGNDISWKCIEVMNSTQPILKLDLTSGYAYTCTCLYMYFLSFMFCSLKHTCMQSHSAYWIWIYNDSLKKNHFSLIKFYLFSVGRDW